MFFFNSYGFVCFVVSVFACITQWVRKQNQAKPITAKEEESTPNEDERKSLFGSFINSVFVDTVAKEDKRTTVSGTATEGQTISLDALFGEGDGVEAVEDVAEDGVEDDDDDEIGESGKGAKGSSKENSNKSVPYSPDYNPVIPEEGLRAAGYSHSHSQSLGLSVSTAVDGIDGEALEESPARIALTPKRKLPPGSGMRKVSKLALIFTELFYCCFNHYLN